jgi:iron(III) transport system ATP-binding protein
MTDVRVSGLTKSYGDTPVLRGVDLHVAAGTLTAVLGPSGCGKTTLLRLIAGFDRPDAGTVVLDGQAVVDGRHWVPPERRRIGYVAQEGALFPHLTVGDNIRFGLARRERRAASRVVELLELVGLDPGHARRYPHQLSGGQQQRVALARALAPRPRAVLLDEPFSSLDTGLRDSTRRAVVGALEAAATTAVLVTHDQAEALSLAAQVAVLRGGLLAQVGSPVDLYRTPVDPQLATFLGEAVLVPAVVRGGVAACPLGRLAVRPGTPDGPARAMIRPEQIAVRPRIGSAAGANGSAPPLRPPGSEPERGAAAQVVGITYYGHDASVQLRLEGDGSIVTARTNGQTATPLGEQVWLDVRGEVVAYPAT